MDTPPPVVVVVLLHNGEERRLPLRCLNPANVSRLFRLIPESVWLVDSQNLTCMQSDNREAFSEVNVMDGPFTVFGEVIQQPSTSTQSHITPSRGPPVAPPFGVVPGARQVGVPPPGVQSAQRRRQQQVPLQPTTKVLKITKCEKGKRGSLKPGKAMVHLAITEGDCNVTAINAKLDSKDGFASYVIADKSGVPISDDECTRMPEYWYFNKGQSGNAVRYYAVKPAKDDSGDSDDSDDYQPAAKIAKIVSRCLAKERKTPQNEQIVCEALEAVHSPLRETLLCTICTQVSREPTICTVCGQLVGCYTCVLTSLAIDERCPLSRCAWSLTNLTGFVKSRLNFDDIPGL